MTSIAIATLVSRRTSRKMAAEVVLMSITAPLGAVNQGLAKISSKITSAFVQRVTLKAQTTPKV
jgi:hypothetical protein